MTRRALPAFVWLVAALAFTAAPAAAATFDLIYADHLQVTTYPSNSGFTLSGTDIGLVVNKGAADIGAAEFFGTMFAATSSDPAVAAYGFINNPGAAITPIHPNEAIGSVSTYNTVLTTLLQPGESLHNTTPYQVISLQVDYPPGYSGQVTFGFTMNMGGEVAQYVIVADFTLGATPADFAIVFPSAARTSSTPIATPAQATTWGELKKLYR